MSSVHFSSQTCEWPTPEWLFNELNEEFGFTIDVCATPENTKCSLFYSENSLSKEWEGVVWCNPPYGRQIGYWVKKAYESSLKGTTCVILLPARTDTKWFHNFILGKAKIRFIKGRLKFGDAENNAPFPSMIVVYENCVE